MSQNIIEKIQNNFIERVSFFPKLFSDMQVKETEKFMYIDCGLSSDTFNVSVVFADSITKDEIESEIVDYYLEKNYPMALWCWDCLKDANKVIKSTRLTFAETNVGMYADTNDFILFDDGQDDFLIKAISNSEEMKLFGKILASIFPDDLERDNIINYCNKLADASLYLNNSVRLYIGYLNGEAVTTGSAGIFKEHAGIYDIATIKEKRRLGLGTKMFDFILRDIKNNFNGACVLLASEDGYNIYKKAGFKPACNVHVYENRHLLK
ncbi:GNAT family N-acetyltransferase [Selenomonadales bacterium OttesenSCG-928-I06]|nr:GNAT family N-acetyltransferase [Selenomonadales bacterium OttesenSCG-928-I06]